MIKGERSGRQGREEMVGRLSTVLRTKHGKGYTSEEREGQWRKQRDLLIWAIDLGGRA